MLPAALLRRTSPLLPTVVVDSANSGLPDWVSFQRASPAWQFNASGLLEQVDANVPRFDHRPGTGDLLGLLIEESRTNLLLWSEAFDDPEWTKTNVTVTADAIAAPDGNTVADAMFETTANGIHDVIQQATFSNDSNVVASVFVRGGLGRTLTAIFVSTGPQWIGARFDLSDGTFVAQEDNVGTELTAHLGHGIDNVGGGWFRIWVAASTSGITSANMHCRVKKGAQQAHVGETDKGLYWWGAQLEEGSFPTSYIKTEGSTVTREADVATTSDVSWLKDGEGTFLLESSVPVTRSTAGERFIAVNDGTLTKSIVLDYATQKSRAIVQGDTNSFNQSTPDNFVAGIARKSALAYAANDIALAVDGAIIATSSTVVPPTGLTQLQIGSDAGGVAKLTNGHIRRIAYWPHRLPVAALRRLSRSAA